MSEFTKIWDQLGRTDPAHTQQFKRGGGFKGTAIKPIWSFRRMTETFGPCGIGWGVGEPTFQIVPGDNREVMVYCTASVWYIDTDTASKTVYGVGGDKVVSYIRASVQYSRPERWENDDEAFKKAFTDAITNALKLIGVGADVHMGRFDDSKYVSAMREEFAEEPAAKPKRVVGFRPDGMRTAHSLKGEKAWDEFARELAECATIPSLKKFALAWSAKVDADKWPDGWRALAKEEIEKRQAAILNGTPDNDQYGEAIPNGQNAYVDNVRAG